MSISWLLLLQASTGPDPALLRAMLERENGLNCYVSVTSTTANVQHDAAFLGARKGMPIRLTLTNGADEDSFDLVAYVPEKPIPAVYNIKGRPLRSQTNDSLVFRQVTTTPTGIQNGTYTFWGLDTDNPKVVWTILSIPAKVNWPGDRNYDKFPDVFGGLRSQKVAKAYGYITHSVAVGECGKNAEVLANEANKFVELKRARPNQMGKDK